MIGKKSIIPDLVSPDKSTTVLFVLESPHSDELLNGYAASGKTGREMTKILLDRSDIPLSLLIKTPAISDALGLPKTGHIGIINVSNYPMQGKAYTDNKLTPPKKIDILEYIRNDLQKKKRIRRKKYADSEKEEMQIKLFASFNNRFACILNKSKIETIVPCGYVANYFVACSLNELTNIDTNIKIIEHIPHPGYKWGNLSHELITILQQLIHARH